MLDRPRPEDAAAHRRFAQDPEAARFLGWTVAQARSAPDSHYEEVVRRFIDDWGAGSRFAFAIRRLADDEPVGTVELQMRPPGREASVSYLVVPNLRGHAIASRAVEAALDWGAREHGLRAATIQCHVDNIPSRRVAEKCGFVLSGRSGAELSFRRDLDEPDRAPHTTPDTISDP